MTKHKRTPAELLAIVRRVLAEADEKEQPLPTISAERVQKIYQSNSVPGHFKTRWMSYDDFVVALREACVTIMEDGK